MMSSGSGTHKHYRGSLHTTDIRHILREVRDETAAARPDL